eukprot:TRINITY_DN10592_c0_g1_i1.p1 TRINITY_DN10592_c0_g1~~TRINITY_DN10592_c0_g1_i1.p1  ORF type:complete len:718 (+),score=154.17 TRINITY_DN10592_c0_g1_i1:32-2185(+)
MPEEAPPDPWRKADAPMSCVVIDISGIVRMNAFVNGTYYLQPNSNYSEAPVYKLWAGLRERGLFLYYARDGRWHVGSEFEKRRMQPSWRLRSAPVSTGTLPGKAQYWEALTAAGWMPMFVRTMVAGRKQIEAAWNMAACTTNSLQVNVQKVPMTPLPLPSSCQVGYFTNVNGIYDLQPVESMLQAPVFKRRRMGLLESELWLYYAQDGRWHVGTTREKNLQKPGRRLRSNDCIRLPTGEAVAGPAGGATASLPGSLDRWEVSTLAGWLCKPSEFFPSTCLGCVFFEGPRFGWKLIQMKPEALARAKVEDAWKAADGKTIPTRLQVTASKEDGCLSVSYIARATSGFYTLVPGGSNREAPAFLREGCMGGGLWLYYARDGRWHIGREHEKNQMMPGWRLRSAECKPGTLPSKDGWERLSCPGCFHAFTLARRSGWERLAYSGWTPTLTQVEESKAEPVSWIAYASELGRRARSICQPRAAASAPEKEQAQEAGEVEEVPAQVQAQGQEVPAQVQAQGQEVPAQVQAQVQEVPAREGLKARTSAVVNCCSTGASQCAYWMAPCCQKGSIFCAESCCCLSERAVSYLFACLSVAFGESLASCLSGCCSGLGSGLSSGLSAARSCCPTWEAPTSPRSCCPVSPPSGGPAQEEVETERRVAEEVSKEAKSQELEAQVQQLQELYQRRFQLAEPEPEEPSSPAPAAAPGWRQTGHSSWTYVAR